MIFLQEFVPLFLLHILVMFQHHEPSRRAVVRQEKTICIACVYVQFIDFLVKFNEKCGSQALNVN